MPAKGVTKVRSKLAETFAEISGPMTERTVTMALIAGGGAADVLTPIDTSNLVNSGFRKVEKSAKGWKGTYGYTASYAAAVHGMPGTLKGQPRESVSEFSTRKGVKAFSSNSGDFWDPDGEPEFLRKGFERDALETIKHIIQQSMKL